MTPEKEQLIESLKQSGITNSDVLLAMETVPREKFVSAALESYAYEDQALPIAYEQTISQPFVVARMTELIVGNGALDSVLEIGTGSGYQAAILSQIYQSVYTVERIKPLFLTAQSRFKALGYSNIHMRYDDGFQGWSEEAPFDAIIVTAATPEIPETLLVQLQEGGYLLIPLGDQIVGQQLTRICRESDDYRIEHFDPVVFVPMLPGKREV